MEVYMLLLAIVHIVAIVPIAHIVRTVPVLAVIMEVAHHLLPPLRRLLVRQPQANLPQLPQLPQLKSRLLLHNNPKSKLLTTETLFSNWAIVNYVKDVSGLMLKC